MPILNEATNDRKKAGDQILCPSCEDEYIELEEQEDGHVIGRHICKGFGVRKVFDQFPEEAAASAEGEAAPFTEVEKPAIRSRKAKGNAATLED